MKLLTLLLAIATLLAGGTATATAAPLASAAAVCADHPNQAAAQRAGDTVDGDGDGIYCESLPCPCAGPDNGGRDEPAPTSPPARPACQRTRGIVDVWLSRTRYPAVLAHIREAIAAGWPRVLRINRRGAEQRRERALQGWPTRPGMDRDEWPMAFARRSWRAHVAYVPSSQNRGAGASIGIKLRRWCDGQRFRVIAY